MPQFEFMRMAMMPKIRPSGEALGAQIDSPEAGKVSIGGTGGGVIDLNLSEAHSMNRQVHAEAKRTFSIVRILHTGPDGSIDESDYIETEVMTEVSFGSGARETYAKPEIKENMELIAEGLTRTNQ